MSEIHVSTHGGRKIRTTIDDAGNIRVEEYLEVGEQHWGSSTRARAAGFYTLWEQVKS